MSVFLLVLMSCGECSETIILDKEAIEIVRSIRDKADSESFHFPPEVLKAFQVADIEITATLRPKYRTYVFRAELASPINRIILRRLSAQSETRIEVRDGKTYITTSAHFQWGRNGRLARLVLDRLEQLAVEAKVKAILKVAAE